MGANYILNYTLLSEHIKSGLYDKFRKGEFFTEDVSLAAAQYILFNLPNVTAELIEPQRILKYFKKPNLTGMAELPYLIGGFKRKLADVFCFLISMSTPNAPISYHVTPAIWINRFFIYTCVDEAPKTLSMDGFSDTIWSIIIFCLVFVALLSYAFQALMPKECHSRFRTIWSSIWFYTADILQNSLSVQAKSSSLQFLLFGWFVGSFVLMSTYSGILKSQFVLEKSNFINTFDDLIKSNVTPFIRNFSPIVYLMREAENLDDPDILALKKKMFKGKSLIYNFNDYNEKIVKMIHDRKMATLDNPRFFLKAFEKLSPRLMKSGKKLHRGKKTLLWFPNSFLFSKDLPSTVKQDIDRLVARFMETGQDIPFHRIQKGIYENSTKSKDISIGCQPIDQIMLKKIFQTWALQMTASFVVFLLEILVFLVFTCKKSMY